ncbi:MAG TPA: MarR family winged helix-turn-helix transcriptional regulator, partial [Leptospiraceae bacterium]|nr:MarR family winged helix-turn-helix transcriptional regulator [Leptospiraceae bacterium]
MFILDDQLSFNIHRVSVILRREMIRCFREFDLNPEQWQVIVSLWEKKKLTQTEIIEITLQDAPSGS